MENTNRMEDMDMSDENQVFDSEEVDSQTSESVEQNNNMPEEREEDVNQEAELQNDEELIQDESKSNENHENERSDKSTDDTKEDQKRKTIQLKGKSEAFLRIVDIAYEVERLESLLNKAREKNKELSSIKLKISEENADYQKQIEELEKICDESKAEIEQLRADLEHRDEVIKIKSADKDESLLEFKNAIGADLKMYYCDFNELKETNMSEDIGYALIDTFESIIKVLEKHGITTEN